MCLKEQGARLLREKEAEGFGVIQTPRGRTLSFSGAFAFVLSTLQPGSVLGRLLQDSRYLHQSGSMKCHVNAKCSLNML